MLLAIITVVFYSYATPYMISITLYEIHLLMTCPFLGSIHETMYCLQEPNRLLANFLLDACVLAAPPVPTPATPHPWASAILDPYWH
jgi:hypothetical protein